MALPGSPTPAAAKQFLIQRVLEQAGQEGVSLSEPERYMLGFSEVNGPPPDRAKVGQFDEQCDSDEYEAKIAGLIRRAHAADKRRGQDASWTDALKALSGEDHYILVMVGQAGLKVPISKVPFSPGEGRAFVTFAIPWLLPTLLFTAGLLVLIDPWGWRLLRTDLRKWVFLAALLAAVYGLGSIINARQMERMFHPKNQTKENRLREDQVC